MTLSRIAAHEADMERVGEAVPDPQQHAPLLDHMVSFFRERHAALHRVARALERRRQLTGCEVRELIT